MVYVIAIIGTFFFIYIPGVTSLKFDEITNCYRSDRKWERGFKAIVMGSLATTVSIIILSLDIFAGQNFLNLLLEPEQSFTLFIWRYFTVLFTSYFVVLVLSFIWGILFHHPKIINYLKRNVFKPKRPKFKHSADTATFIKINNIKYVSIWDKEFGQQITGEVEKADEDEKIMTFLLKGAIIYNSVGEEIRRAKTYKLVRRKNKLLVAFSKDYQLPGGRLRIQT